MFDPSLSKQQTTSSRMLAACLLLLAAGAWAQAPATPPASLTIAAAGSQPSAGGPAANFTGAVRVDPLFQPQAPSRTAAAYVTFEPGARSAWHSHPLGQTLVVTAGVGRVQQWGGKVQVIRPGNVIWTPPGVKHWHGAAPTTALTHMAIQEADQGKTVEWMEKVSDVQYNQEQ